MGENVRNAIDCDLINLDTLDQFLCPKKYFHSPKMLYLNFKSYYDMLY